MGSSWADALPNLIIGLREGLEAGLIVTILVSAVRKLAPGKSLAPIWLGVIAAIATAVSFGLVLYVTEQSLSSTALAVFAGVTSVLAVILITWMIFVMRKTAASMAGEVKGKVADALLAGSTALAVTAFIAVVREGLETALFIFTNLQAASSTLAPIIGAIVGLIIAALICVGIYKRAVKLNLKKFFNITGIILIVLAAGVLSYGIGDLQEAGVLPGFTNKAFDVSATISNGTWYFQIIRGVFNIDTSMTVLQVVSYLGYLIIVMTLFIRGGKKMQAEFAAKAAAKAAETSAPTAAATANETAAEKAAEPADTPADNDAETPAEAEEKIPALASVASETPGGEPDKPEDRRRMALIGGAVIAVPVVLAIGFALLLSNPSGGSTATSQDVEVTYDSCVPKWTAPPAGQSSMVIKNSSGEAVDIELVTAPGGSIIAEIEVLGPGTQRTLPLNLAPGDYQWRCAWGTKPPELSSVQTVTGSNSDASTALKPVTEEDMAPYLEEYRTFVKGKLATLKTQVDTLQTATSSGNRAQAQAAWLPAHLTYHNIGAAYGAFGETGDAIDGLAQSLQDGVNSEEFTGFHKIEYLLWNNGSVADAAAEAKELDKNVAKLNKLLPTFIFEPGEVAIRAHEILEDTGRFSLTGQDDYGSGTSYAAAGADTDGTRVLLNILAPLLNERTPELVPEASIWLDRLNAELVGAKQSGKWVAPQYLPQITRQPVNAANGQALEILAPIPDILEIQKA